MWPDSVTNIFNYSMRQWRPAMLSLRRACNERLNAFLGNPREDIGIASIPYIPINGAVNYLYPQNVAAGDIWHIQNWIENYCIYFIRRRLSGELLPYNYDFTSKTTIPTYTSFNDLVNNSLIKGFRRCTTMPQTPNSFTDPAFTYGKVQQGDIVGPWTIQDCAILLSDLTWFYRDLVEWTDDPEWEINRILCYGNDVNLDVAKAQCIAMYPEGSSFNNLFATYPSAANETWFSSGAYHVTSNRRRKYLIRTSAESTDIIKDIDLYVFAKTSSTFADFNDPVRNNAYSRWDQLQGNVVNYPLSSKALGEFSATHPGPPWNAGWYADSAAMVVKLDRVGGLTNY